MIKPKYSSETEQYVLESLMGWGDPSNFRVQKAFLKLNADCFYVVAHKAIYVIIEECFSKNQSFDFVSILTQIPSENDNLYHALTCLMENFTANHSSNASFEFFCDRLITLSQLRKQVYLTQRMIESVSECSSPEKSHEILVEGLTEISGLSYRESKQGINNAEISENFYEGKIASEIKLPTNSKMLNDALHGGIMPKSLIIVAAGASVGKTGFSIFLMDAIARMQPGTDSLFFSIEMEYKHIWMRHVGICAGKSFDKLSENERLAGIAKAMQVPVTIFDTTMTPSVSDIDYILTTCRLRAMERPLSVIVVDYLGLIESKSSFERNDLKQSYITGKLAQLAIELNCTVIALSQINRGSANRGVEDRCPWPHDAADSSGGHRSSSLWLGVDRPELYQSDPCYRNQFVVKCRKNRFGDIFDIIYAFNEGTFQEVNKGWFKQPHPIEKDPMKRIFS